MNNEQIEDKKRQRTALSLVGGVLLLILIGGGGYYMLQQQKTIEVMAEQYELDKQMLEEEYNDLSLQYEGYKFTINNDSLLAKLSSEQAKVQRLMEELKTVKRTNAKRIGELRRELESLRKVMRHYVVQIDSLNTVNQALTAENRAHRAQITRISSEREVLENEKQALSKQVELASKLVVSNVQTELLNSRGKTTKRLNKVKQLKFSYYIDRNITASPGEKTIYMRLTKPDGSLLSKPNSGSFAFEGSQVPYSIARQVEYGGEAVSMTMYWDVEEFLPEGTYTIELFADGYLIGRSSFSLK